MCDAPGVGELTPAEVEALMAENDCIIDALLTRGRDVLKIVRVDRYVPVDLQKALSFADPTCCVTDCPRAYRLERDHRDDFARSKRTAFDNLDRACDHHHEMKTRYGWTFVRGPDGRCWMEAPRE